MANLKPKGNGWEGIFEPDKAFMGSHCLQPQRLLAFMRLRVLRFHANLHNNGGRRKIDINEDDLGMGWLNSSENVTCVPVPRPLPGARGSGLKSLSKLNYL